MLYDIVKWLHIVGAMVLFGTGLGIAFFKFASYAVDATEARLFVARTTVRADFLFTAPAAVLQPVTGAALIVLAGYDGDEPWLLASYALFVLAGACWLPVVWMQIRMHRLLADAIANREAPPPAYHRLFRLWFLLGWPAFLGLLAIVYLMSARP